MKNTTRIKQFLLLGGDIIIFYLSLYITLAIRYLSIPTSEKIISHAGPFTIILVIWFFVFYIGRLYDLNFIIEKVKFLQAISNSLIAAGIASFLFFYLLPQQDINPKTNLFIYIFVFAILFYFWRQTYLWLLKSRLPKKNIAIIGYNKQVQELIAEIKKRPHFGYQIAFIVDDAHHNINNDHGVKITNNLSGLKHLALEYKLNSIVLTVNPHESQELRSILFECLPLKIAYVTLPNFYENITGRIPLDTINQMWFLENLSENSKGWFDAFKRASDIILACILLTVTIPFWLLIALGIKLESRGSVFFMQIRAGSAGHPFKILKFRTMTTANNDLSPTTANDNRITKFGSFLRKSRLDEIPQVINIIKGEMSFIGPRPERPEYVIELEKNIPFYKERMLVKPGLTGWDQISGEYHSPSLEDSIKKLQYDLYYIKNRSIYLDLSITLKTIITVLSRAGI